MESELDNLQRRVAELEAALAAISRKERRSPFPRWAGLTMLIGAVIVAIGLVFPFTSGARAIQKPQGPLKVTAPFEVFDNNGQRLFAVVADPTSGGGDAIFFNNAGVPAAEIRSTTKAGTGEIRIMDGADTKISLGITAADAGSIYLFSKSQAVTIINGGAGIRQTNAQRQPVAQLGVDDNGQGYAMVANRAGTFLSKISVAAGGSSGRVEVSSGGDIKVLMGVLENGKGDVCANGEKGSACLSQINPRY